MTMTRVKNGEVVEVGLPSRLRGRPRADLASKGWRMVKGTPKPAPSDDGMKWTYGKPYHYDTDEDVVLGTWSKVDRKSALLARRRQLAELPRAKFKLALHEMGKLDAVSQAMAAESVEPRAKIIWEDATSFQRMDNDVLALAKAAGLTDDELDEVFGIAPEAAPTD